MPVVKNTLVETGSTKSLESLSLTVDQMQQQIDQLKNHNHDTVDTDHPDPVKHKYISFAKSAVRIAAGIALIWPQSIILAGVFLIAAEILGIVEELV